MRKNCQSNWRKLIVSIHEMGGKTGDSNYWGISSFKILSPLTPHVDETIEVISGCSEFCFMFLNSVSYDCLQYYDSGSWKQVWRSESSITGHENCLIIPWPIPLILFFVWLTQMQATRLLCLSLWCLFSSGHVFVDVHKWWLLLLYKYFVAWQWRPCRMMVCRQVIRGPGSWLCEWQWDWRPAADQWCACRYNNSVIENGDQGADTRATRSAATGHRVSCSVDWTYWNANTGPHFLTCRQMKFLSKQIICTWVFAVDLPPFWPTDQHTEILSQWYWIFLHCSVIIWLLMEK
jgi:hypothetical protein